MLNVEVTIRFEVRSALGGVREHEICAVLEVGEQVRLTVLAKPFSAVTVIVEVPDCPGADAVVLTRPSIEKSALAGVAATHAVIKFLTSNEPNPVTWS